MFKIIRNIFIVFIISTSPIVYAASSGWTGYSKVVEIVTVASGGTNVRLDPALSGCESQSGYGPAYASIYPSHPGFPQFHANLLAAMMSGKEVRLYLSNDTCMAVEMRIHN